MSLQLTPDRLAAVYEMLRTFPPFSRWKLPPSEEVGFHVARTDRWHAAWWMVGDAHQIEVSDKKHGHLASLVCSLAHEMLHVKQKVANTETKGSEHNAEFKKLAASVCKRFGWDEKQFLG